MARERDHHPHAGPQPHGMDPSVLRLLDAIAEAMAQADIHALRADTTDPKGRRGGDAAAPPTIREP